MKFHIFSLKHTRDADLYITFWRKENCGYCYSLPWAAEYDEETIAANEAYYNNVSDAIAVPVAVVAALAIEPKAGSIDGNVGPVVRNTKMHRAVLEGCHRPFVPAANPDPMYLGFLRSVLCYGNDITLSQIPGAPGEAYKSKLQMPDGSWVESGLQCSLTASLEGLDTEIGKNLGTFFAEVQK